MTQIKHKAEYGLIILSFYLADIHRLAVGGVGRSAYATQKWGLSRATLPQWHKPHPVKSHPAAKFSPWVRASMFLREWYENV
jgi:hypothetical protein